MVAMWHRLKSQKSKAMETTMKTSTPKNLLLCSECGNVAEVKWNGRGLCNDCIRKLAERYNPKPSWKEPKDMPPFWRYHPNAVEEGLFIDQDRYYGRRTTNY